MLPSVAELARQLKLDVVLFRAYNIPSYLEKKTEAMKKSVVEKIRYLATDGFAADEIISLARSTPDNLIAMCSHGYSGVKRWVLGSATETVVRHSGDPVLVIRAV